MTTADLAAWLLADDGPIAEDERVARESRSILLIARMDFVARDPAAEATFRQFEWWDPARVLAECAAKRAIVEAWQRADESSRWPDFNGGVETGLAQAVEILAQVYAGREGWKPEWDA